MIFIDKEQTMSRWIDGNALIGELQKDEERFDKEADDCRKNSRNYTDCYIQAMSSRADGIRDAIIEVYDAPSIDIVRCRECKYASDDGTYGCMCEHFNDTSDAYHRMWSDDFCSRGERNSSEKPNNCEHITEDGVTCAKYPACDDCLDNPLNKVKGSERLVKGSEKPNNSTIEDCSDVGKE